MGFYGFHFAVVVLCLLELKGFAGVQTGTTCPSHLSDVRDGVTYMFRDTCYLFVDDELFWSRARDACWGLGGEMLSIHNEATMDFIRKTLNSKELGWRRNGVWLGLRNRNSRWRWTDGRTISYDNWARDEPSTIFGTMSVEDCGQMRKDDNWKWHDYICGSLRYHYNYICEFPMKEQKEAASGRAGKEGTDTSKGGDDEDTKTSRDTDDEDGASSPPATSRIASSASNQEEDNGNLMKVIVVLSLTAGFLFILLLLFLLIRHPKKVAKAAERAVLYTNPHATTPQPPGAVVESLLTHRQLSNMTTTSGDTVRPPPPIPATRPPPMNANPYLQLNNLYSEPQIIQSNGNLSCTTMDVELQTHSCSCNNHPHTGSSQSSSQLDTDSDLGACGGSEADADMRRPLMSPSPPGKNSPLASITTTKTSPTPPLSNPNGCPAHSKLVHPESYCPYSATTTATNTSFSPPPSEYITMSSLSSKSSSCEIQMQDPPSSLQDKPSQDKHTYSNVHLDFREGTAVENLYEALP